MRLFYSDLYTMELPPGHKFPMQKYRLLREALSAHPAMEFLESPLAARDMVELAHDHDYVARFLEGRLTRPEIRRIGFPWSESLVRRTLASAGGTLAATKTAWERGCSGALAGGTHHAFYAEGSGYCVFNDIAIGILWLREAGHAQRAAVIDLDVHQGDGTAAIFADDPDVYTLSLHGAHNFPFRKQQSRRDVPLPDDTGDEPYLQVLASELPAIASARPEVIFYQSGVDALAADRLGRLSLTAEGLQRRDQMVFAFARSLQVPLVITLGGGYSDPIEITVAAHAATFRAAAEIFGN